jgi:GrpB-like predicted nucleotidyltransferase (UPF0157 family)
MLGLKSGTVTLCAYSPLWRRTFVNERRRLRRHAGGQPCRIEHIGSTAVPGLTAKPIIDMAICIPTFRRLKTWIRILTEAGYGYKGEYGLPGRHFFVRGEPVTHHLHLVESGSDHWNKWILFRDHLRRRPDAARRYNAFKRRMALRHRLDRDAYTRSKTPFIARMLMEAGERQG